MHLKVRYCSLESDLHHISCEDVTNVFKTRLLELYYTQLDAFFAFNHELDSLSVKQSLKGGPALTTNRLLILGLPCAH